LSLVTTSFDELLAVSVLKLNDWVGKGISIVLHNSESLAAQDDIEMEDLNYYYADYSRYA